MANKKSSNRTPSKLLHSADRKKAEKIQTALYRIADAASAVTDMQEFYAALHRIVGNLMYAKNFYVTLYDSATQMISSPYFCDEAGDILPPPSKLEEYSKSLRAYVLNTGKTLHISAEEIEEGKRRGEFEPMGTPAEDWVGVPLKVDGQVTGSLTIQSYKKDIRYDKHDVQLLEFVAQHIAVALTRARAIDETRQRNAELQIINSVQDGLASKLEMPAIYELVGEKIRVTFNAQVVSIDTYDRSLQLLQSQYYFEGDRALPGTKYPCFGFRKHVLESLQPLVINNEMSRWMDEYNNPVNLGAQPKSAIFVPMIVGDEAIGVISLQNNDQENAFSEADLRLLSTLANSMSVALENARLFAETQRLLNETEQRNAEFAIINSVQEGLASKLDMQAIYELVGNKLREIFQNVDLSIRIHDVNTNMMHYPYTYENGQRINIKPFQISERGFGPYVLRTQESLLINENMPQEAQKFGSGVVPGTLMSKSMVMVPLISGGKSRGLITLNDMQHEHAFSESDVRLLETLANSMSVALDNAHLFDETQRLLKETKQRNTELQIINSVQEGLASKLDLQAIYELIGEKVREVFNVRVVDIVNYDPVANLISMPYSFEKGDRSIFSPREPYGFRQQVIHSHKPLLINQNFVELASHYNNPLLTGEWPKSALFVPLLVEGKVKSIISIQDLDRENAFSTSDVQLLQTLSNAMSVALENARLFEETQHLLKETEQRAQELATVNTVSAALVGELDLNTLIELVGEQIRSVFKADIAFVALLDREKGIINFPYQYGQQYIDPIQKGQGITSKIIQSGQPLVINGDMDRQVQQMGVTRIGKHARSFLGVPIFVGGESFGVLSVQHSEQEEIFTDDDLRLLSTIAANVGIALQNARLFSETQRLYQAERQAHEQTETLRSVAQALNRSLSLRKVFDLVLIEIQKVIPYDSAGIYQVQDNRRVFVTGHGFTNLEDLIGVGFEFNQQDDEIGYLISQSLQPLVLEDASEQYPQYFSKGLHAATKIRSYMAIPIVHNEKLIGMITLDREEAGFYKDQYVELAMAFAAQAATAINNARLFDETQRLLKETEQRNAELALINSVQEGLASKLAIQAIYDLVGDRLRDVFHSKDVEIRIYDAKTNMIHNPYTCENGERISIRSYLLPVRGFVPYVLHTLDNLIVNENLAQEMEKYGSRIVAGTQMAKSLMMVPLVINDQAHGLITISDMQHEHAFKESDVRLLETLANSMSVALENARLWEEEKIYRKALERELEIGREIQAGFLPEVLPQVEGWEIAASLMSAREVAGDFYDVFELPDGTIGLVIADVCDKGVGAALFMTLFRSLIRVTSNLEFFEHSEGVVSPHSTPERLKRAILLTNNYIAETHGDSGMFATIFFGILDPRNGKLTYINGGHEPPLIINSGGTRETLSTTGPAIGAIADCKFDLGEIQLNTGDMLFAFTDGVPDSKDPQGEFFGRERLFEILHRTSASVHEMVDTIETELLEYIGSATQFDDITLLAVKWITLATMIPETENDTQD